ncbi:LacI family transcriptional regulator [Siphonobacter sp. BAB-5405]|nr:LacI family transcriptional regulator [Siphonobacter sp. BAB-5405]
MPMNVSIKEIARRLKISPSTVSRALQNHPRIGLRTRERVQELAQQLNYVPSATARNLRSGKTFMLGVVLPEIQENFFSKAINGIEEVAFARGYTVALYQSHDQYEREKQVLDVLSRQVVDGVILSVAKESHQFDHIQKLLQHQIPLVLFDRIPPSIDTHQVSCNMEMGAYEATGLLVKKGFKRIALLNGPASLVASQERYEGYVRALTEAGLSPEPALVESVDLSTEATRRIMEQWLALPQPPDSVLTFNDYVALDAMGVCRAKGLRLNTDISFVSFANLPMNAYLEHPPLASVEQHPYRMGYTAAELILNAIAQPQASFEKVILQPELMVLS